MNVQSGSFLVFLAVTAALCCGTARRSRPAAKELLAAACLAAYLSGGGLGGFLVLGLGTAVSRWAVRRLTRGTPPAQRRQTAAVAACWHIAVLAVFKYTGFFTGGAVEVGWAPLGLSFFTFQQLWLLREVYTGAFRPDTTGDLFLYSFFFPTITSGPILRPSGFFPQLEAAGFLRPSGGDLAAGGYALCLGMAKKTLLADPLGIVVGNGWSQLAALTAPAAWTVILAYALQLYLDFSGYCDIVTGAARLLGIRLPVNFRLPYRALSVTDFWKHWHITLTTFLRECLYFPLGGSRRGTVRTCVNILVVFLVSGLWHGAGWTFLVWGALHGLAQVAERLWGPARERLPKGLRWGLTFLFVSLAWVFFRAPSLTDAGALLSAAFTPEAGWMAESLTAGVLESEMTALRTLFPALSGILPELALAGLLAAGGTAALWPRSIQERMEDFRPTVWRGACCGVLLVWSVLSFSGVATFIYSNF